jgi:hypothetical protein
MAGKGIIALLVAALAASVLTAAASAGKPTTERIDVDETEADPFLTAECGVDVTVHFEGQVIIRTFSGAGAGPAEIQTINIVATVTAGDNSHRIRDVGTDHVQIKPDGTAILMIVGQIPFNFTGVLKIDLATDEAILEPHHSLEGQIEEACAALAA